MLLATAACNFSTAELQKVLRAWGVLYIFTSKWAFRHSGVQFLMSSRSTDLRTRRFNRPAFRLTRHTNHWKNTAFRDVSNICRGCIFFLLTFALVHLLPSDLTACLICFSTLHIVGSLLFKLPSIKYTKTSQILMDHGGTELETNIPSYHIISSFWSCFSNLSFPGEKTALSEISWRHHLNWNQIYPGFMPAT